MAAHRERPHGSRDGGLAKRAIAVVAVGALLVGCQAEVPSPGAPVSASPAASTALTEPSPNPTASSSPSPSLAALPQGSEPVTLDPAQFAPAIDHPYWPMIPGTTWTYREQDLEGSRQDVEVTVTQDTKQILGIDATVVHDVVTEDGKVVEDTLDWYAQDLAGNLWYLGEDTKEYDEGSVSTEGSWEAGVDGAQPGIVLPAAPEDGMAYRQEYLAGQAEDSAEVLSLDEWVEVPFGQFTDVLMTKDYTPLEPAVLEHKFYAKGIGPVFVVAVSGGTSIEELLTFEPGQP